MTRSRLDLLLQYYRDEPGDPFNLYGLALEYLKSDVEKSREFFELLLNNHEEYVPSYYHAARLYQDLNEREKALETYKKGITIARKKGDMKALRELQSAYDELMYE